MDELKKELFDGLKARFAEIENADAENVEALKDETLNEMKEAVAKIEAIDALDYYVSLAKDCKKSVDDEVANLAVAIWNLEEYVERCNEIAADHDLEFSIPDAEKTEMNALWKAIKPFVETNYDKQNEDFEIPF